jgi:hypothetical protein
MAWAACLQAMAAWLMVPTASRIAAVWQSDNGGWHLAPHRSLFSRFCLLFSSRLFTVGMVGR